MPNTNGEIEAPTAPVMFMTPVTVPLDGPATSIGTAQAGPSTISKKKFEAARQMIAVRALLAVAAGTRNTAAPSKAGAATARLENVKRLVRLNKVSVSMPPAMSPIIAVISGMVAKTPTD